MRQKRSPGNKPKASRKTKVSTASESTALQKIFSLVKSKTGVDLSRYKPNTIQRRIQRQVRLQKCKNLSEYAVYLRSRPEKVKELYDDMFIHVTEFYRDPPAYESLAKNVFPVIVKSKKKGDSIRLWIPGCSSGEEVYSLAISLREFLRTKKVNFKIQIIATDISDTSIKIARKGVYPESSLVLMKPQLRDRYFDQVSEGYKIKKEVREDCVFSLHDLAVDPVFSQLDLISCRNVLIYFSKELQNDILPLFQFGLRPGGFLWLGTSEAPLFIRKNFEAIDPKYKIFEKPLARPARPMEIPATSRIFVQPPEILLRPRKKAKSKAKTSSTVRELQVKLAEQEEYLEELREQFETYREELLSANEELQASNEEMHSTNEELEAAQEELRCNNEELVTMNDELDLRNSELNQLNESLSRSEQRFRLLVEGVKDYAIFMLTPQGNVASWNEGARRLKGYAADEIKGKHFSIFYSEEDRRNGKPAWELETAMSEGRVEDEGWRIRKDGSSFYANVVITKITDASGKLLGFSKITRDLTEKKRTEEELRHSEERFRLMVSSVQDYAIFMLDPTGIITSWNEGAKRIKGYEPSEIIGSHFSRFYLPEDIARQHPQYELNVAGKVGRYEEEGWRLRKDGSRFWANVVITRVNDAHGKLNGFVKVTRDLTERMQNEEKLRKAYEGLEKKVQERTKDLELALSVRDEFLSIASHELKTPLTSLKLQLQLGKRKLGLNDDEIDLESVRLSIEKGVKQVDSLTRLVEDLLDVSRLQTGVFKLIPHEMELSSLVEDVVQRFLPQLTAASCTVHLDLAPSLRGNWDKGRLEQVLINLIFNAIKYAPGKPVTIQTHSLGDQVEVTIKDEGPGIPKEKQELIFERFERVSNEQHIGGLGLGLFISRKIIEAHHGNLTVESEPGKGSLFRVKIPLNKL